MKTFLVWREEANNMLASQCMPVKYVPIESSFELGFEQTLTRWISQWEDAAPNLTSRHYCDSDAHPTVDADATSWLLCTLRLWRWQSIAAYVVASTAAAAGAAVALHRSTTRRGRTWTDTKRRSQRSCTCWTVLIIIIILLLLLH